MQIASEPVRESEQVNIALDAAQMTILFAVNVLFLAEGGDAYSGNNVRIWCDKMHCDPLSDARSGRQW